MKPEDTRDEKREPRPEREQPQRTVAPPIEREHETYSGILEEDERREHDAPRS